MAPPPDRFLIWGAGGHGKVVADLLRAVGHELVGFVDADAAKWGLEVEPGGGRVILLESDLHVGGLPDDVDALALAIGSNATRLACLRAAPEAAFPRLVHPTAAVSPSSVIGEGSVVFAQAVLNAAARVGRAVIVNSGAIVEHDCIVDDGAHLSPGALLAGGVHIGEGAWVGAGAVVLTGLRVGRGAVVGAGSVVVRDVADGDTVVGNPARPLPPRQAS